MAIANWQLEKIMETAVTIQDLTTSETVTFYQNEIADSAVENYIGVGESRLQGNNPYIAVTGDEYKIITLQVKVDGQTTRDKLETLRDGAAAGHLFRVHPAKVDLSATYYDCILPPDVLIDFIFSGYEMAGEIHGLIFYEAELLPA